MGVDAIMAVKTNRHYSQEEITELAYDAAQSFFMGNFWIVRPGECCGPPHHAIYDVKTVYPEYFEDVDDYYNIPLYPEPPQILRIDLATRYYGKGYERGNLPLIMSIAQWCDARIDGVVWYGGDHEGMETFTPEVRQELWEHFCKHGHFPYQAFFNDKDIPAPICDFCNKPLIRYRYGPGLTRGYTCLGCGAKLETTDNGKTFHEIKDDIEV